MAAGRLEPGARGAQQRRDGVAGRRRRTRRRRRSARRAPAGRGRAQVVGVTEPVVLGPQVGVLTRLRVDAPRSRSSPSRSSRPRGPVARPASRSLAARCGGRAARRRSRVAVAAAGARAAPAEGVERLALLRRRPQPRLVGLAVHGDEELGQLGQHPDRAAAAAHVRPRAALRRDGAGHDQASSSSSAPASAARARRRVTGRRVTTPSTTACRRRGRTRPESARPPRSRPRPETTIVLPAPVSPVMTVSPGRRARGRRRR